MMNLHTNIRYAGKDATGNPKDVALMRETARANFRRAEGHYKVRLVRVVSESLNYNADGQYTELLTEGEFEPV